MPSRHSVGTYQGNALTSYSPENARPQSSQFAEPLWTDPGSNSGISVCELISTGVGGEHLSSLLTLPPPLHPRTPSPLASTHLPPLFFFFLAQSGNNSSNPKILGCEEKSRSHL